MKIFNENTGFAGQVGQPNKLLLVREFFKL